MWFPKQWKTTTVKSTLFPPCFHLGVKDNTYCAYMSSCPTGNAKALLVIFRLRLALRRENQFCFYRRTSSYTQDNDNKNKSRRFWFTWQDDTEMWSSDNCYHRVCLKSKGERGIFFRTNFLEPVILDGEERLKRNDLNVMDISIGTPWSNGVTGKHLDEVRELADRFGIV